MSITVVDKGAGASGESGAEGEGQTTLTAMSTAGESEVNLSSSKRCTEAEYCW